MFTIGEIQGNAVILTIPNYSVKAMYWDYMIKAYRCQAAKSLRLVVKLCLTARPCILGRRGRLSRFIPWKPTASATETLLLDSGMSLMNDSLSIEENIKTNFLVPNAYLFEDPTNLIKQEFRDPAQYNSIIKAIATGSSRMSEICTKTGLDTGLTTSYLHKLITFL